VALRELEQAQAALNAAQNDVRSGETRARSRTAIGYAFWATKTNDEIVAFEESGKDQCRNADLCADCGHHCAAQDGTWTSMSMPAPSDPVFVVGDLSHRCG